MNMRKKAVSRQPLATLEARTSSSAVTPCHPPRTRPSAPPAALFQSFKVSKFQSFRSTAAFTLIEMIIVVGIISVLLAMLYGSLERAQKFSRRTITYTELKTIEAALKQYHAHYHRWPNMTNIATMAFSNGGDEGFIIDANVAALLQGSRATTLQAQLSDDQIARGNPEMMPFIEFPRVAPASGFPINPFKSSSANIPGDTTRAYRVLFDTNGDRQIAIPPDPDATGSTDTNIIADVAVWTIIPGTRRVDTSGNPQNVGDVVFGTWQDFGIPK